VHDVDVLGQGLAHAAREDLGAAVLDEPAADLGLDGALQLLDAPRGVVAGEPARERARVDRAGALQEALQALEKLDPIWAKEFFPKSGLEADDMALAPLEVPQRSKFVRQRRHPRVRLQKSLAAVSTNLKQNCRLEIKTASLTGGVAATNMHLAPGTQVQLKMQVGLRNVQATALMRDYRAQDMSFEIVDMSLEERGRFRKILMDSMVRTADGKPAV